LNNNSSFTSDNNDLGKNPYPAEYYYYDGDTQLFSLPETPSKQVPGTPDFTPKSLPPQNEYENEETSLQNMKKNTTKNKKNKTKEKEKKKENEEKKENNPTNKKTSQETLDNYFSPLSDAGVDDCPPSPAPVMSPRAIESSAKAQFRVYSHNVNGLRDESKLEHIPRLMKKKTTRRLPYSRDSPCWRF